VIFELKDVGRSFEVRYNTGVLTLDEVLVLYRALVAFCTPQYEVRRVEVTKIAADTWRYRFTSATKAWTQTIRFTSPADPVAQVSVTTDEWPDTVISVHTATRTECQRLLRLFDIESIEFTLL